MEELFKQFENMDKMPIIELFIDNEWQYFTIHLDKKYNSFWTNTNDVEPVVLEIDSDFSLDENLQQFYDKLIEHLINNNHILGE